MQKRVAFIILMLIGLLMLSACNSRNEQLESLSEKHREETINVFVSILPQLDFVQKIGGERVKVSVMIPPGANPGSYDISPAQLKELHDADIYIKIGHLPFEKNWMERIKSANPDILVVDSSENIKIIDNNPHIWLSPRLVKLQLKTICQALIEFDPENKDYYISNKNKYTGELNNLDQQIKETFSSLSQRKFLVYHPAWEYFAHDYGLEQIAIEKDGKEPGSREMSEIISEARSNNIKVIFASPQHDSRSAEALAQELDGEVVLLDPLPLHYVQNLKDVAENFARVLK